MNYLQKKKLAFMSMANRIKGFVQTVTGALPLTLTNCVDNKSIINYKLYGQCVQDGTPSINNPVEVESVGDFSKNLFDMDSCEYMHGDRKGESILSTTALNVDIYLKAGTYSLTFKCDKEATIFLRKGQTTSGYFATTKLTPNTVSKVLSFTYESDEWMRISSFKSGAVFYDFMLVEGKYDANTMPEYSQYNKYKIPVVVNDTTTNIYLDEPLRKVGDYADYIDYIRGKVVRNIFHCSLLDIVGKVTGGTMYSNTGLCRVSSSVRPSANMLIAPLSRSMKGGTGINSNAVGLYFENQYRNLYCYFNSNDVGLTEGMSSSEIANAIKQYIQDNEIDIYYVLKTPIEETIELPKIPTHKGTSIITADSSIQPSNAEITYYSSLKE